MQFTINEVVGSGVNNGGALDQIQLALFLTSFGESSGSSSGVMARNPAIFFTTNPHLN
jgi:hypothetical protein